MVNVARGGEMPSSTNRRTYFLEKVNLHNNILYKVVCCDVTVVVAVIEDNEQTRRKLRA